MIQLKYVSLNHDSVLDLIQSFQGWSVLVVFNQLIHEVQAWLRLRKEARFDRSRHAVGEASVKGFPDVCCATMLHWRSANGATTWCHGNHKKPWSPHGSDGRIGRYGWMRWCQAIPRQSNARDVEENKNFWFFFREFYLMAVVVNIYAGEMRRLQSSRPRG
jgi:hypothetical protein